MCLIQILKGSPHPFQRQNPAQRPANQPIPLFDIAPNLADCRPLQFRGDSMKPKYNAGYILAIKPQKTITPAAILPGRVYVVRAAGFPAAIVGRLYLKEDTGQEITATIHRENPNFEDIKIPITRIIELYRVVASISCEE